MDKMKINEPYLLNWGYEINYCSLKPMLHGKKHTERFFQCSIFFIIEQRKVS